MNRIPISVIGNRDINWYVLRVEGAYEHKASLAIQIYGSIGVIPDFGLVRQTWVPEMTIRSQFKKKRVSTLPGYLFMQALLSDKLYESLKKPDLPHIFGWLQNRKCWPSFVSNNEIEHLIELENQDINVRPKPLFDVGERVMFPSLNMEGTISSASDNAVFLNVELFHKSFIVKVQPQHFDELIRVEEGDNN